MQLELGAGQGLVIARPQVGVLLPSGGDPSRILAAVDAATAAEAATHRVLGRRLATLLTGDEADSVPDFGLVAVSEDATLVFLYGAVDALVHTTDGREQRVSGAEVATWADRLFGADLATVVIGSPGVTAPAEASPYVVRDGSVPGGWFRVDPAAVGATPVAAVPVVAAQPAAVSEPQPEPQPQAEPAPQPEPQPAPQPEPAPQPQPAVQPEPAAEPQAPALSYVLAFDDGSRFELTSRAVLGREPETDPEVAQGQVQGIAIHDERMTVSRVHAEIRLSGERAELYDRGSTNGTFVLNAAGDGWDRVVPGQAGVLVPGWRGAIGQCTFVYEVAPRQ